MFKKVICILVVVFSFQNELKAQDTVYIIKEIIREEVRRVRPGSDSIPDKQNEISFGLGYSIIFGGFANGFNNGFEENYFGSYNFKYTRYINERHAVGATFVYLNAPQNYYYDDDLIPGGISPDDSRFFTLYMAHYRLNYYNRNNATMYFGASLGLMSIFEKYRYIDDSNGAIITNRNALVVPIADLTLFGIQLRNKTVSPYAEVGFGLKGFIRGGVNFRF